MSNDKVERKPRQDLVKIRPIRPVKYTKGKKIQQRLRMQICVGSNIARELGWVDGDYINVSQNSTKEFVILKNKGKFKTTHDELWPVKSYLFRKIKKSYSFSINLPCIYISDDDLKLREVNHEIIEEEGDKILKVYMEENEDGV